MFNKCSLLIKNGVNNIEAIKSLEKTNVIGPTSDADTLINKNDDPQSKLLQAISWENLEVTEDVISNLMNTASISVEDKLKK